MKTMKLKTSRSTSNEKRRQTETREHEIQKRRKAKERAAEEAAAKERARRRRPLVIAVWVVVIAVVAGGLYVLYDLSHKRNAQARDEMANTKIVFESEPDQELLRRVDGSYYSASTDEYDVTTYGYTSLDENDVVVERTVSTSMPGGEFLWITHYDEVDIAVRVIDGEEADPQPRVETQRCTVQPIDPSKPSYTGDPHESSSYEPGTGESLPKDDFWGDSLSPLCKDRVTIWVPDGTVQP